LQLPPRDATSPAPQSASVKPAPLSPKLDHSHSYASPTNILPRRSRGLDFSRAATSLHHSTLADQASPDSSPTIGSRAMNIPGSRRNGEYGHGPTEHTSNSLWSMMGNQERMHISSSLGSNTQMLSDSSSTSDDDDFMDEDMDEAFVTTPQASKMGAPPGGGGGGLQALQGAPWMPGGGSPAVNSLLSFQQRQRQRQRKQSKKKIRGPLGLGFNSPSMAGAMSKSPPHNIALSRDMASPHGRRESISWAANQLHISSTGSESDENHNRQLEGVDSPSRPHVIRRAVTRRGNLLPKTKGFARIRAALMEESAPVEAEFRREAEVVHQVFESDMDLEPRLPPARPHSEANTALSSPSLVPASQGDAAMDELDAMMMDTNGGNGGALGVVTTPGGSSFKQQALKNSKGKIFWDTFSDSSSPASANGSSRGRPPRITPPPPSFGLTAIRGGSQGGGQEEDVNMDSPSGSHTTANTSNNNNANPFAVPSTTTTTSSSGASGNGTPHQFQLPASGYQSIGPGGPPSAAEITRRINSKRRRDDDFDPASFKRRAVSPGMSSNGGGNGNGNGSVHGSPILQSPLQGYLGGGGWSGGNGNGNSRPGSVGGDSTNGGNGKKHHVGGRIGFQGMVDTNDGITRLSIE